MMSSGRSYSTVGEGRVSWKAAELCLMRTEQAYEAARQEATAGLLHAGKVSWAGKSLDRAQEAALSGVSARRVMRHLELCTSKLEEARRWNDIVHHLIGAAHESCMMADAEVCAGRLYGPYVRRAWKAVASAQSAKSRCRSVKQVKKILNGCEKWLEEGRRWHNMVQLLINAAEDCCTEADTEVLAGRYYDPGVRRAWMAVHDAMAAKARCRSVKQISNILQRCDRWLEQARAGKPALRRSKRGEAVC